MTCGVLLLAAGQSTRMRGTDKLLRDIDGIPLIRRSAIQCCQTGLPVWVTLPPGSPRADHLNGMDITEVPVAGPMSVSIAAGLAHAPAEITHMIIVLADMPDITTDHIAAIAQAARGSDRIWRGATAQGKPGHPVALPARLFPTLINAPQSDHGAGSVIRAEHAELLRLPGQAAITDLDTPEAWEAWEASRHT